MRRWVLLGILVITTGWGSWVLFQWHREAAQRHREAVWLTAYQHATQVFYGGDYATAEKIFADILPNAEKWYPKDRRLAELLSMLGTSYRVEHKYERAEPVLKRALQVYETISPSDPLGTERTELNLAGIYLDREDYASAERYFSEALSLSERTPGGPIYERGSALLNLGFIRMVQGHYLEAEQLLNRSVEALTSDPSPWAQGDLANARYRLGGVYAMDNRYGEAKQQYLKALEIQEKVSGPNSQEVGRTLQGLGQAYQAEGDTLKATELLNRAQEITRRSSAPGDDTSAGILVDLGEAAQNKGKYAEAESRYKHAIDIYEKTVGPEHPDFARALVYLGCLYRDEEQFDITKAGPLLERALAIREKALGPDHPSTASTLSNLSLLYSYEHNFAEAEQFGKRALPIDEKAFGLQSLEVATDLNRIGIAQRDLKKFAQAEISLKRALTIREKNLPSNHPWIAVSLDNLASVYLAQREFVKAAPLIERAQAIRSHSSAS
jgi:tetratricopeptide (TPR) repeat protein